jgi:hypothetical protein
MIRAGIPAEANRLSGEWVFVDLGFAEKAKSCGLLLGDGNPEEVAFSQLKARLLEVVASDHGPLNLLVESPLSVAFNEHGNPTGRAIEKRESQTRYWYVGLGCSVLVAATYLLRAIHDANPRREIRLFEGLASFKRKGVRSSHSNDVINLRKVILDGGSTSGFVVPAEQLAASPKHQLHSAFLVAGMDFGVPAVVVLGG